MGNSSFAVFLNDPMRFGLVVHDLFLPHESLSTMLTIVGLLASVGVQVSHQVPVGLKICENKISLTLSQPLFWDLKSCFATYVLFKTSLMGLINLPPLRSKFSLVPLATT